MLRSAAAALALVSVFSLPACSFASHDEAGRATHACTPPAGGRCAADVAWPGPLLVSRDGRVLHGIVLCGGTLAVVEQTSSRVTVRLHVGAVGAGAMSCARVDVRTRLGAPLGDRPVYDAVSGKRLHVDATS